MEDSLDCLNPISDINLTLSLYIPVIKEKVTFENMQSLFVTNNIGNISRVDFVYNANGVRQAFIHFNSWFKNPHSLLIQKQILDPKTPVILKNNNLIHSNFEQDNIILLPNKNPKPAVNVDLINTLQDRIKFLETKFKELESKDTLLQENTFKRLRTNC